MRRKVISGAGDDRAKLEALRDRLAHEMDSCTDRRVLAALARIFVTVIAELSQLKKPAGSRVDEIAKRRARRQAAAGFTG